MRGRRKDFFLGGPKVVNFGLYPSKLVKQPFFANNLKIQGWLSPPCLPPSDAHVTMKKSAKKQQVQVQMIQRIIASRNVTQDNGNTNNFWKGSRWFCRQCLRTVCYFLQPESRKWLFGKLHLCPSIWTQCYGSFRP